VKPFQTKKWSCGTKLIIAMVLQSTGQCCWLQIQRSGFDSLPYQIFWEVVGLEWGPLNLLRSYLKEKVAARSLEIRHYGCRDPSRWPRGTLYPQKSALTPPTSSGCSVGIVRSRTQATEFIIVAIWRKQHTYSSIWLPTYSHVEFCPERDHGIFIFVYK
jgi:hypothetical protein